MSDSSASRSPVIGVLALQGAFARHIGVLNSLGVKTREVRLPRDLQGVDALVLPGGESSTMSMLLERAELFDPIADRLADGMAAFGTCAGLILLSTDIVDGRADQRCFGVLDATVRRNGYGRQVDSFDATIEVDGVEGGPVDVAFIRAPVVDRVGPDVDVLAEVEGRPVLLRSGSVLAASFHPELAGPAGTVDPRIHRHFIEEVI